MVNLGKHLKQKSMILFWGKSPHMPKHRHIDQAFVTFSGLMLVVSAHISRQIDTIGNNREPIAVN